MSYNVIQSTSVSDLVTAVNDFITANPTYAPVGKPEFLGGSWSQAVGVPVSSGGATSVVYTSSNVALTDGTTNFVDIPGLEFPYLPNKNYKIFFIGRVSALSSAVGCGFSIESSTPISSVSLLFTHNNSSSGMGGGTSISSGTSQIVSNQMPGTLEYPVVGNAHIMTNSLAGTAKLRFRAEVAGVPTSCIQGMIMIVEEIS